MFNALVIAITTVSALFLVVFVLLHSGKGSGLSDMFGGGGGLSGGTAIERRLDRITVITAVLFFLGVFWLSWKWH